MEEYLTVKELAERIKLAPQTIYNLISLGRFVLGIHYVKPSPKKVLFKWAAVVAWLEDTSGQTSQSEWSRKQRDPVISRIKI